jgi:hypothetical protein
VRYCLATLTPPSRYVAEEKKVLGELDVGDLLRLEGPSTKDRSEGFAHMRSRDGGAVRLPTRVSGSQRIGGRIPTGPNNNPWANQVESRVGRNPLLAAVSGLS